MAKVNILWFFKINCTKRHTCNEQTFWPIRSEENERFSWIARNDAGISASTCVSVRKVYNNIRWPVKKIYNAQIGCFWFYSAAVAVNADKTVVSCSKNPLFGTTN